MIQDGTPILEKSPQVKRGSLNLSNLDNLQHFDLYTNKLGLLWEMSLQSALAQKRIPHLETGLGDSKATPQAQSKSPNGKEQQGVRRSFPRWLINLICLLSIFLAKAAEELHRPILGRVPLCQSSDLVMVKRALCPRIDQTPPSEQYSRILVQIVLASSPTLQLQSHTILTKLSLENKYRQKSHRRATQSKIRPTHSSASSVKTIPTSNSLSLRLQIHMSNLLPGSA